VFFRCDLPDFLDAEAVGLGVGVPGQSEAVEQHLGQGTAAAFGEDRLAGVEFDAGRVTVGLFPILADAHVAGGDAAHGSARVIEHLGRGETGVKFDAQGFGLPGQPAGEQADAAEIVAVVLHLRRRGQGNRPFAGQEHEVVVGGGRHQRRLAGPPVGQQLIQGAGLDHRSRQDMGADLGALFQDADADLVTMFGGKLFQPDRGGQPRGAAADDHDVILHDFAFHSLILLRTGRPPRWTAGHYAPARTGPIRADGIRRSGAGDQRALNRRTGRNLLSW